MPIFYGDECIGAFEIANRTEGYQPEMIPLLKPFCSALSILLELYSCLPSPRCPSSSSATVSLSATAPLDIHSAELSASVIQSISDGIIVTDTDFCIRLMNNGALHVLDIVGSSCPNPIGRSLQEIVSPVLLGQIDWVQIARNSPSRLVGTRGEGYVRDSHGTEIPVMFSITSFLFATRRYFCFIFSDIRDKRNCEEKIRFLAFLSHELRNPAQVLITGLQDLLLQQHSQQQQQQQQQKLVSSCSLDEELTVLLDASKMVTRIVNDVLHLSKLESGKVALNEEACSIRDVIEKVRALMQGQKRSPEVCLTTFVDPSVPPFIVIDQVCLTQYCF